jgi:hypothetical protein
MGRPEEIAALIDFFSNPEANAPEEIRATAAQIEQNPRARAAFLAEQERAAAEVAQKVEYTQHRIRVAEQEAERARTAGRAFDRSHIAHIEELPSAMADFAGLTELADKLRPDMRERVTLPAMQRRAMPWESGDTVDIPSHEVQRNLGIGASPEGAIGGAVGGLVDRFNNSDTSEADLNDDLARTRAATEAPGSGGMLTRVLAGFPQMLIAPEIKGAGMLASAARIGANALPAAAQSAATTSSLSDTSEGPTFSEHFQRDLPVALGFGALGEGAIAGVGAARNAIREFAPAANDAWARAFERSIGNLSPQQKLLRDVPESVGALERARATMTPGEFARYERMGQAAGGGVGAHARDLSRVFDELGIGPMTPADTAARRLGAEADSIAQQRLVAGTTVPQPNTAPRGMGVNRNALLREYYDDAVDLANTPNVLGREGTANTMMQLGQQVGRDTTSVIPWERARELRGGLQDTVQEFQGATSALPYAGKQRDAAVTEMTRLLNRHIDDGLAAQAGPAARDAERELRRRAQLVGAGDESGQQAMLRTAEGSPSTSEAVNAASGNPVRGAAQFIFRHGDSAMSRIYGTLADLGFGEVPTALTGVGTAVETAVPAAVRGAVTMRRPEYGPPAPEEASPAAANLDARTAPAQPRATRGARRRAMERQAMERQALEAAAAQAPAAPTPEVTP